MSDFDRIARQARLNPDPNLEKKYTLARLIRTREDAKKVFRVIVSQLELTVGGVDLPDREAAQILAGRHNDLFGDEFSESDFRWETREMEELTREMWAIVWDAVCNWGTPKEQMKPGMPDTYRMAFDHVSEYVALLDAKHCSEHGGFKTYRGLSLARDLLAALETAWPGTCGVIELPRNPRDLPTASN